MAAPVNPGDDDGDRELSGLEIGNSPSERVNIVAAISSPPEFSRTLDGASTLTVELSDHSRKLLASPALQGRVYAKVLGFNYDMVAVAKSGDRIALTFEDSIVAALRRVTAWDGIPASAVSRAEVVRRFCKAAGVSCLIDPGVTAIYNSALEAPKATDATQSTGWDILRGLADDVQLRCFSDGFNLHFGSDEWLVGLTAPLTISEFVGPVHMIDFDLDAGKPVSKASVEVDSERWGLFAGRGVRIAGLYWADGDWIVDSFTRTLTSQRGKLELVRKQFVLVEPPPDSEGDEGEIGNVPTDGGAVDISADLARLRQCEAGGDYKKNTGNGYYGAYQFDLKTWQKELGYSGRPDEADSATQDEAARKLYAKRGWNPWPACSKKLGLVDRRSSSSATSTGTAASGAREKFVQAALSKSGTPYVWGAKGPNTFDCSGLVQWASQQAGKQLTAPSTSQSKAVRKISVAEALRTRGALLFRIGVNGNHVAISLGNGSTVEARGKAYKNGTFGGAAGRTWTSGGIWL